MIYHEEDVETESQDPEDHEDCREASYRCPDRSAVAAFI
jgi:hypothetical protein